jgi:hypothetical protein
MANNMPAPAAKILTCQIKLRSFELMANDYASFEIIGLKSSIK